MLICDTHADTLYAMQDINRDSAMPLDITKERLLCTDDVHVQALALFVGADGAREVKQGIVQRELAAFERLTREQGFVQITELSQARAGVPNALLTIEGGEAFENDVSNVDRFADLGVRAAALVWNNENLLAYPAVSGCDKGLKPFGREVMSRMHRRHMAVDISHLNIRGSYDAIDSGVPPMASHSCARALCDHPRNLSDDQLRALFSAGGYVGVNFYPVFLHESGKADLDRVVDHMAYLCEMGGEGCVGLGSDFDGIGAYPDGLRHAGDMPKLFTRMRERGFGEPLVRAIAGENFARYLMRA